MEGCAAAATPLIQQPVSPPQVLVSRWLSVPSQPPASSNISHDYLGCSQQPAKLEKSKGAGTCPEPRHPKPAPSAHTPGARPALCSQPAECHPSSLTGSSAAPSHAPSHRQRRGHLCPDNRGGRGSTSPSPRARLTLWYTQNRARFVFGVAARLAELCGACVSSTHLGGHPRLEATVEASVSSVLPL